MPTCHECGRETDEVCERCQRPTCDRSYFEREHLGVCLCCNAEIVATDMPLVEWPHRLRKPLDGVRLEDLHINKEPPAT
jgi:hypothetical protein